MARPVIYLIGATLAAAALGLGCRDDRAVHDEPSNLAPYSMPNSMPSEQAPVEESAGVQDASTSTEPPNAVGGGPRNLDNGPHAAGASGASAAGKSAGAVGTVEIAAVKKGAPAAPSSKGAMPSPSGSTQGKPASGTRAPAAPKPPSGRPIMGD